MILKVCEQLCESLPQTVINIVYLHLKWEKTAGSEIATTAAPAGPERPSVGKAELVSSAPIPNVRLNQWDHHKENPKIL